MGLGAKDLDRLQTAINLSQTSSAAQAADILKQLLRKHPTNALAVHFLGIAAAHQGHHEAAIAQLKKSVLMEPNNQNFKMNYVTYLMNASRYQEALEFFESCLKKEDRNPLWFYGCGASLLKLKRYLEAVTYFDKALSIDPHFFDALNERGAALGALQQYEQGLESCNKALAINPRSDAVYNNLGLNLHGLRRYQEALMCFDKAIIINPNFHDAFYNRGNSLIELTRRDEALAAYDKAFALKPDFAEALHARGLLFQKVNMHEQAIASFSKALAVDSNSKYSLGTLVTSMFAVCDWRNLPCLLSLIYEHITYNKSIIPPFGFLALSDAPEKQLQCARNYIQDLIAVLPSPLSCQPPYQHDKIRIAYLSADFHDHSTAYLIAELFELHDRARFEITGVSFGPNDNSEMRARLVKSMDRFLDVQHKSDHDIALMLNNLEIDIAVDLKGPTAESRPIILAHRPAPIQVAYLGYQGTTGSDFIDYVIGDKIALPLGMQPFFTEKIIHLPDCHQISDSKRKIPDRTPSRSEFDLPPQGFVFCNFNNNNKITPEIFEIWMRLLSKVDGSVLWLISENDSAKANLSREASAHRIDPTRLIFAEKASINEHLLRHRVADLFLDTAPLCAHTSASRALWVGLPMLTIRGHTFAGRITASMLHAIGLPELVANNISEYETVALKLATNAPLLEGIRRRLEENRLTSPVFDTDRTRRNLEAAYTMMWDRYQRGESPANFAVDPTG